MAPASCRCTLEPRTSANPSRSVRGRRPILLDSLLVLTISFIAQATHFSYQQGRAVICGDSAQYVAQAEALLDPVQTPHFEMRKPGYILFLAGIALALGNMGWAAIAANHVLLATLPLAAYGFGVHLRGRVLGWLAAFLTIARLQVVTHGDRVMSEALYVCLLSFALLALMVGLSARRAGRFLLVAGGLLGVAWLTRGNATIVIVVAVAAIVLVHRTNRRRLIALSACFLLPVAACVMFECGLNLRYAGAFRPSNGTIGAMLLLRARHFEGFDWPASEDDATVLSFLPERTPEDAYVADPLDAWVARYRAVHDRGMTEWDYDSRMGKVARTILAENAGAYVYSSLRLAGRHLLRDPDAQALSPVPNSRRRPPVGSLDAMHQTLTIDSTSDDTNATTTEPDEATGDWDNVWFSYYGLPHLSPQRAAALVAKLQTAADTKAPFGDEKVWRAIRYWKTKPVAHWALTSATWLGSLWPGFALMGCVWFGLNRRTCLLLTAIYVSDAAALGLIMPTTTRQQFAWIMSDTVLAAATCVGIAAVVTGWIRHQQSARPPQPVPTAVDGRYAPGTS